MKKIMNSPLTPRAVTAKTSLHPPCLCNNAIPFPGVHRPRAAEGIIALPSSPVAIGPGFICETQDGHVAHALGRLLFKHGRPMLVEHVGGIMLEHRLTGEVLTAGYDDGYTIVDVRPYL